MTETKTPAEPRLEYLRPTAIAPHPKNPRTDLGDLTELAASIKGAGVLEPLIVVPAKGRGKYTLIAGHRRHAAAIKAVRKTVPCIVRDDLAADDRGQLEVMLTENLHRSDLNAVEEGNAYQTLLEFPDLDVKALAATTGHSQATIKNRIRLANAPETVRERIVTGEITLNDAIALADFEDDEETHSRLLQFVGTSNFAYNVEYARKRRAWEKVVAKETKQLQATGVTVFDSHAALEEDELPSYETDEPYEWTPVIDLAPEEIPADALRAAVPTRLADAQGENFDHYVKMPLTPDAEGVLSNPVLANKAPARPELTPEQVAERDRREQEAAELDAAHTVRRQFLAEHIKTGDTNTAIACARAELARWVNPDSWNFDTIVELLALPTRVGDDDEKYRTTLVNHINRLTLEQLVIAMTLARNAADEFDMFTNTHCYKRTHVWREKLTTTFGYEFTDVEQRVADRLTADAT